MFSNRPSPSVAVNVVGPRVVGDQQVEPPVVVQVEPGDAEPVEASGVDHTGLHAWCR